MKQLPRAVPCEPPTTVEYIAPVVWLWTERIKTVDRVSELAEQRGWKITLKALDFETIAVRVTPPAEPYVDAEFTVKS